MEKKMKCITFDKAAQDALPEDIKAKMKADRERAKITRDYNDMLQLVKEQIGEKADENRVNCYICECGYITKTIDIDSGVTPMFHQCEKCGRRNSRSSFYRDVAPQLEPTQEWYRPSLEETINAHPSLREHILNGGLDCRKINNDKNGKEK